MKLSQQGYIEIASHEGVSLTPYLDSGGVKTVSIGLTHSDLPDLASWSWNKKLTLQEACDLFRHKVNAYINGVNNALKVPQTQYQFDALVSITYNIGIYGTTTSTFMRNINNGATMDSITNSWKKWNKDNGVVVQGLVNRRNAEVNLYKNGMYKNNGMIRLINVDPKSHKEVGGHNVNVSQYFTGL